jgi:hypothetical protein
MCDFRNTGSVRCEDRAEARASLCSSISTLACQGIITEELASRMRNDCSKQFVTFCDACLREEIEFNQSILDRNVNE